ncbi:hypothetical protein CRE_17828 [Caenorhabditis remanei]|uniref:Uncharacterized protein n=1 Tax=Caenorhabditis remanei TaxID=31234 RepID=E3MDJ9_CAERE|nr:hypothetical protein CRE_17828 [Caenorhabditis remanei]
MGLWSSDEEDVEKDLRNSRIKSSNENNRRVTANVENHESDLKAQRHRYQQELHEKKLEEIEGINEATREQLKEVGMEAFQKKRALAEEADRFRCLKLAEQEEELEHIKMENALKKEEEKKRTKKVVKEQELTENEIDKVNKRHVDEKINETQKTENLRERLRDEQKELNSKISKEFHETETRSLETRLQMEKEVFDKEEENYQMVLKGKIEISKDIVERQRQLLNVKILNSSNDAIRNVNATVSILKTSANAMDEAFQEISTNLSKEMDSDERDAMKPRLKLISSQLTNTVKDSDDLERKTIKISVRNERVTMVDQIIAVKKTITDAKNCISDVSRGLNAKNREFDMKLQKKIQKKMNAVIEAEHQRAVLAQKQQNEREIAEAAERNLAEVERKIAEVDGFKQKQEMELLEWQATVQARGSEMKAQLTAEGDAVIAKQKIEHQEESRKLEEMKRSLDGQRTKLMEMLEEGNKRRTDMQKEHNEITAKQALDHQNYILNANADLNKFVLDKQEEKKALAASGRAQKQALLDEKLEVQQFKAIGGKILMDKISSANLQDDVQTKCQGIRIYYTAFKNAYSDQEMPLKKLIANMKRKNLITTFPQPKIVYSTFDALKKESDRFSVPTEFKNLEKTLEELITNIETINDLFVDVEGCIEDYQKTQKRGIQRLDVLQETPQNEEKLEKLHKEATETFEKMKQTTGVLNKTIKELDIPTSRAVDDEINQQMAKLYGDSQKQIAGGSSGTADDLVEVFPAPTQPEVVYGTRPNVSQSSRAAKNFRDQLRQRTAALRQTPQHSDIREKSESKKPKPNPLPEHDTEKDQYEIEENEREKEFERQLNLKMSENEEKESKLREEKARNDEHSNLKFQQELENQSRDHEENFKMAQEEINNFEKETRRLLEQRINKWKANQIALYNCILLQQQFKEQEKSWAEWLESLKTSISNVIMRFQLFEKVIESINKGGASYEKILMNELTSLHKSVLPAHEMVCEAWCSVSKLAEKVTDKIFLVILQKRFVDISNKLYNVLEVIDNGMLNSFQIRKEPIDQIYQYFRELSTHDIPTTVQLRDLSKNAKLEDYKVIEKPKVYKNSKIVIQEIFQ